jgi:DNA-binding protein YbaB
VDGRGRIRNLTIDPVAFDGRDAELLADLVLGAVAEAQRRADDIAESEVKRVSPAGASAT